MPRAALASISDLSAAKVQIYLSAEIEDFAEDRRKNRRRFFCDSTPIRLFVSFEHSYNRATLGTAKL